MLTFAGKNCSVTEPYRVLFETVHGSQAYGLARARSNPDVKGVIAGPRHWYLGPLHGPERVEVSADHVRYDVRKFFQLAEEASPTVLELLFAEPSDHRIVHPLAARLLAVREQFLSRNVARRFSSCATDELRRIHRHREWLLAPPSQPPSRAEFGLPERRTVPVDQRRAAEKPLAHMGVDPDGLAPDFLELLQREGRYEQARRRFQQYENWQDNRHPGRAALERRFGYDTKPAMHVVRLLRMGAEILQTGEVHVWRADRSELLAVRDGAWPYDALVAYVAEMRVEINRLDALSPLPQYPDHDAIASLCGELLTEHLQTF